MNRTFCIATVSAFLLVLAATEVNAAEAISLTTLLDEMVDRGGLARLPAPAYTCRQASSWDRRASSPDNKETWYANMDRSHFDRSEERDGRKEFVMMDAAGPGAVVRFWATWHGPGGGEFSNGTLRVYLDGNEKPAIEGPVANLLDGGALTGPPLSEGVSPQTSYRYRGHNLYLPIPYARHCKITYSANVLVDAGGYKGDALYYQINYRTYDQGTNVKSFTMDQLQQCRAAIARVQQRLLEPEAPADDDPSAKLDGKLAAGESRDLTIDGPAAIRALTINLDADDLAQALRSTVLEMHYDGERTVWCPLGAFFGLGYQFEPYKTWYTHVSENGDMTCYWVMPFEKSCRIAVHNLGAKPVAVKAEAKHGKWQWDERSLHFHATWHQLTDIHTQTNKGAEAGAFDVNYVTVSGRGVYVGDTLTIFNGHPSWWGEGDEKVFVDGESFPSHFGTGTEDYYGYAWSNPNSFASPFHAQPYGLGANHIDMAVNSRYRALDAIPFTKSIKFDMELWHSHATTVDYAPATFFYAAPGATVSVQPDADSAKLPVKRAVEPAGVQGALEGEKFKVLTKTGGETEVQDVADWHWSRGGQLWWLDAKVGDTLTLEFNVKKAGRYHVIAELTKAPDYGIVAIRINDQNAEKPLDRYFTSVAHDPLPLGEFALKQGPNQLTVEIVGSNEKAIKRHMFGLDYLKLEPTTK